MSDVIRFRIPADRDTLLRVYEPVLGPSFGGSRQLTKYLVPAYASELDEDVVKRVKLFHRNRREQESPLRAYADAYRAPEVKAPSAIIRVLMREREEMLARNLSLDHAFDGLYLWAEAEVREIKPETRERMRELYHEFVPAVKLHLNFVEVPNQ